MEELARVYLGGGFYSNWRKTVKQSVPEACYYSPDTDSRQQSICMYVEDDIRGVANSDIMFAYISKEQPQFGGVAAEIGYAFALGKTIILVSDKEEIDGFLVGLSKYFCTTIPAGIVRLRKALTIWCGKI